VAADTVLAKSKAAKLAEKASPAETEISTTNSAEVSTAMTAVATVTELIAKTAARVEVRRGGFGEGSDWSIAGSDARPQR